MRRFLLVLVLIVLPVVPAMAQYYVVPGGAIAPDGGLHYVVPAGKPFNVNATEAYAYPPGIFGQYQYGPAYYNSPLYWVPYPAVAVPMPW
jgi:hypothetical protein